MQKILHIEPVSFTMWLVVVSLALTIFIGMELHKLWWNYRYRAMPKLL